MSDPDAKAFEYYDDPGHREPARGRPRRRPDRALTQHVPVRFPAPTIEAVRRLADLDGMTVSAWIRRTVETAVRSRSGAPVDSAEISESAQTVFERLRRDIEELAVAFERSDRVA